MSKNYTVKKKSLLHKFNKLFNASIVNNWDFWKKKVTVCDYFWLSVSSTLKCIILVPLGVFAVVLLALLIVSLTFYVIITWLGIFASLLGIYAPYLLADDWVLAYLVFACSLSLIPIVGEEIFNLETYPKWIKRKSRENVEEKQPSLIVSAYRAHKEKYCKFVEFE